MAIYHLHTEIVKRSDNASATAAAAYQAHDKITDERTGVINDYSRRKGHVDKGIMAPANSPEWVHDRSKLWNAVELAEKRRDAQLARKFDMALPKELTSIQQQQLVWTFAQDELVKRGMIADYALHEPHRTKIKDKEGKEIELSNDNRHVHFAVTMRSIGPDGFGDKNRDWNKRETLEELREAWAVHTNAALAAANRPERIDHRSLAVQHEEAENESLVGASDSIAWADKAADLNRPPQRHMGKDATALERKGQPTELGDYNRKIAADHIDRKMSRLDKQIRAEEIKLKEEAATLAAMQEKAKPQDVVVHPKPTKPEPVKPVEIKMEKIQEVIQTPDTTRSKDLHAPLGEPTPTIYSVPPVNPSPVSPIKPVVPVSPAQREVRPLPPSEKNTPSPQQQEVDPAWYLKVLERIRELIYQWRVAVRQDKPAEEARLEASILAEVTKSGHKRIHFDVEGPIMLDDTKAIVNLIGAEKKRLGIPPTTQQQGKGR